MKKLTDLVYVDVKLLKYNFNLIRTNLKPKWF